MRSWRLGLLYFLDAEVAARKQSAVVACRHFDVDPADVEAQTRTRELFGLAGENLQQQPFRCDGNPNIHVLAMASSPTTT